MGSQQEQYRMLTLVCSIEKKRGNDPCQDEGDGTSLLPPLSPHVLLRQPSSRVSFGSQKAEI